MRLLEDLSLSMPITLTSSAVANLASMVQWHPHAAAHTDACKVCTIALVKLSMHAIAELRFGGIGKVSCTIPDDPQCCFVSVPKADDGLDIGGPKAPYVHYCRPALPQGSLSPILLIRPFRLRYS